MVVLNFMTVPIVKGLDRSPLLTSFFFGMVMKSYLFGIYICIFLLYVSFPGKIYS